MQRRILLLVLVGVVVLLVAGMRSARSQNAYQLHRLTASEYAARLPEVLDLTTDRHNPTLLSAVEDEFLARYGTQQATYADMQRVYHFFKGDVYADYGSWHRAMIQAWLRENHIDLDKTKLLHFDDYTIHVTPRDFKGNGGHEWLLTVETVSRVVDPIENYLIAEFIGGAYRLTETPLPWRGEVGYTYSDWRGGTTQPLFFGDLNGDGVPEWVVALGGVGRNFQNWGWLFVMEWLNGQLTDVSAPADKGNPMAYASPGGGGAPVFPSGVTIEYVKAFTQNALDIVIRHHTGDNWGCTWTEVYTFSWNDKSYTLADNQTVYDNVQGCEWRMAEAAMWAGDLKTAIAHHERGLTLNSRVGGSIPIQSSIELVQYAKIRLAIAYSLEGQSEKAATLLTALKAEKPESDVMGQLITAITSVPGNEPFSICTGAYGVFLSYLTQSVQDRINSGVPTKSRLGGTFDNDGTPWQRIGYSPSPSRAGCDEKLGLKYLVEHSTFSTNASPVDQLTVKGIKVAASLQLDMNDDGQMEWVISPALDTPPLFFAPIADQTYRVSYVPVETRSADTLMAVRLLPDHAGLALVTTTSRHTKLTCPAQAPGITAGPPPSTFLDIWRLGSGVLVSVASIPRCDPVVLQYEWHTADRSLYGWAQVTHKQPGNQADLAQAWYNWDATLQEYLPPDRVDQPPLPPDDRPMSWWDFRRHLNDALGKSQYDDALSLIDVALAHPFNDFASSDVRASLRYWRGVVLELEGNAGAAVREYVSVYEAMPASVWTRLAMLHLEMVV